jgi:hypothetical protein
MLEDEVLDPAGNDFEQLLDEPFPLLLVNVRLQPQFLPKLLGSLDDVGIRLRGFSFSGESLLFRMRFSRVGCWKNS